MTSENDKVLLRRYHEEGDLAAREQLIEQYMSLVRSLARRYSYRGEQLDDLVQIGAIGLIKAIDRFDLDRGVELTTYATPNIIGEIKRRSASSPRRPRSRRKTSWKRSRAAAPTAPYRYRPAGVRTRTASSIRWSLWGRKSTSTKSRRIARC